MESFGRYIAVVGVMALLFLIPIADCKIKTRHIQDLQVENLRVRYLDDIAKSRVIRLSEWEAFCAQVNSMGQGYRIELAIGIPQYVQKENEISSKKVYVMYYENTIIEELYREGKIILEQGAIVMIKADRPEWML